MKYEEYYREVRQKRNDESRQGAEKFKEPWTAEDIETLVTLWDPAELETLAEMLGRTVEAVRQRYYETQNKPAPVVAAEAALVKVDKWARGFTSLEEMGY